MRESVINIEDAAARLPELVEQIHAKQETAVIVKSGHPLVRIVPLPPSEQEDLSAFLARWRRRFPDPDEQFAEVVDELRTSVQPVRNPWD